MKGLVLVARLFVILSVAAVTTQADEVQSCFSYNSTEHTALNINWQSMTSNETHLFNVYYYPTGSTMMRRLSCYNESSVAGIPVEEMRASYDIDVKLVPNELCDNNTAAVIIGSSNAMYGYLSNLTVALSEDKAIVNFTCVLPCRTDFITGCNVTLSSSCGDSRSKECSISDVDGFVPRECTVTFEGLTAGNYSYTARVLSTQLLTVEENRPEISDSFVTSSESSFVCPTDSTNANGNDEASSDDDDGILDDLKSLPVPVYAAIGAAVVVMLIVVIVLVVLVCRLRRKKNAKSKQEAKRKHNTPAVYNLETSTTALFDNQFAMAEPDLKPYFLMSNQTGVHPTTGSDYLQHGDHSENGSNFRKSGTDFSSDESTTGSSHSALLVQNSTVVDDDQDYDEVDDSRVPHHPDYYNNLVHSGAEQKFQFACPPTPKRGTYEGLNQNASDSQYEFPPDAVMDSSNKVELIGGHEYETPPALQDSDAAARTGLYDKLSAKPENSYDQVAIELDYGAPSSHDPVTTTTYDSLLPKQGASKEGSPVQGVSNDDKSSTIKHNPGPITGDMYSIPKKFVTKSASVISHDYDIVEEKHDGKSTVF